MEEAINLGSIDSFPGKNVDFALKVIKKNNIKANDKLFVSGIPFKFELSKFVEEKYNIIRITSGNCGLMFAR